MKNFEISFTEGTGRRSITIAAESIDHLASSSLLEWAAEEYGISYDDLETDGSDVWYTDADGEQTTVMRGIHVDTKATV